MAEKLQWVAKERPSALPTAEHFEIRKFTLPELRTGQVLIKNEAFSVDPYHREVMNDCDSAHGVALIGRSLGRVIQTRTSAAAEGDLVVHRCGWSTHAVTDEFNVVKEYSDIPNTAYLGILGATGLTAYVGLTRIIAIKPEQSIIITAAAGAVGTAAASFAQALGAKHIYGITSTRQKVKQISSLPFSQVWTYSDGDLAVSIHDDIADVALEGVGGDMLGHIIRAVRPNGTIAWVGGISGYNSNEGPQAPSNIYHLVYKEQRLHGYLVRNHLDVNQEFLDFAVPKIKSGDFPIIETRHHGFEEAPKAFTELFDSKNIGKQVVTL